EQDSEPKTVNRSAEVGERILITDAISFGGRYNNGDILTVVSINVGDGAGVNVDAKGNRAYVLHEEYEVIVEDEEDVIEVGDEVILDAGDDEDIRPLIGFYNGETYEVTDMNPEHTDQEGDMISIGYNWGGHEGYPMQVQVKLTRKEEDKQEYLYDATYVH